MSGWHDDEVLLGKFYEWQSYIVYRQFYYNTYGWAKGNERLGTLRYERQCVGVLLGQAWHVGVWD